jgi:hypothetical protein
MKFKSRTIVVSLTLVASIVGASSHALRVPIAGLMKHPKKFDEKRVTFVAYYDSGDGHGTNVRLGPSDSGPRIFLEFKNTKLPRQQIQRIPSGSYVLITGTFRYRDVKVTHHKDFNTIVSGFGWMNDYDKEVAEITEFMRVDGPKR